MLFKAKYAMLSNDTWQWHAYGGMVRRASAHSPSTLCLVNTMVKHNVFAKMGHDMRRHEHAMSTVVCLWM